MKKFVYLFLALLLPGLIFIFLKNFGKNEFAIQVYYEHNVDSLNLACGTHYDSPYRISEALLDTLGWKKEGATVFTFQPLSEAPELKRVGDRFDPDEVRVREVTTVDSVKLNRWRSCAFFCKPDRDVVIVDKDRRIRGYYRSQLRADVDRLLLELEILLKKY